MADRKIVIDDTTTGLHGQCPTADTGTLPRIKINSPSAAAVCETITTAEAADGSALPGSGRKSPGYREWWGNFWTGAISTTAKIMAEVVTVTAQVAGAPTAYNIAWKDAAGNAMFSILRAASSPLVTAVFSDGTNTTYLIPSATYGGTVGSWWVQMMSDLMGIYNRGWTAASGIPAIVFRVFADATAADVITETQDNDGSALHRVYGDGSTETGVKVDGGMFERVMRASYADAAIHQMWTSPVLPPKSVMEIDAVVHAVKSTGTRHGYWHIRGIFYRPNAGVITQQWWDDISGTDPSNPPQWKVFLELDTATHVAMIDVVAEATTDVKIVVRHSIVTPA